MTVQELQNFNPNAKVMYNVAYYGYIDKNAPEGMLLFDGDYDYEPPGGRL